ncbi:MAG: hypothetical protein H0U57_12010 [Tatlockia sp.]|nr:hypothetical protein [Tatlockia sp.]
MKIHRSTIYRELKRNSLTTIWTNHVPCYLSSSTQKRYLNVEKDIPNWDLITNCVPMSMIN